MYIKLFIYNNWMCAHRHLRTCMHACIHTHIHPCMHACMHTYTHTYIYIYMCITVYLCVCARMLTHAQAHIACGKYVDRSTHRILSWVCVLFLLLQGKLCKNHLKKEGEALAVVTLQHLEPSKFPGGPIAWSWSERGAEARKSSSWFRPILPCLPSFQTLA